MQIQQLRLLGRQTLGAIQKGEISQPGAGPEDVQAQRDLADLETDLLLSHVSGLTRVEILAHSGDSLKPEAVSEFLALLERRKLHEPIAYLTGQKEFYGFEFEITPDVLIPRPETELLVDHLLARLIPICEEAKPFSLIDIGTGSGAILLSIARSLAERFGEEVMQGLKFIGVDRSPEALQVAARNAAAFELLPYVLFGPSDLLAVFNGPSGPNGKLDAFPRPIFFVANLPYIPDSEVLPRTVEEFEPRIALRGGSDGLDLVRRCIAQWRELAKNGEPLFLEVGEGQAPKVLSGASGDSARAHIDLRGVERVVELEKQGESAE